MKKVFRLVFVLPPALLPGLGTLIAQTNKVRVEPSFK